MDLALLVGAQKIWPPWEPFGGAVKLRPLSGSPSPRAMNARACARAHRIVWKSAALFMMAPHWALTQVSAVGEGARRGGVLGKQGCRFTRRGCTVHTWC